MVAAAVPRPRAQKRPQERQGLFVTDIRTQAQDKKGSKRRKKHDKRDGGDEDDEEDDRMGKAKMVGANPAQLTKTLTFKVCV